MAVQVAVVTELCPCQLRLDDAARRRQMDHIVVSELAQAAAHGNAPQSQLFVPLVVEGVVQARQAASEVECGQHFGR